MMTGLVYCLGAIAWWFLLEICKLLLWDQHEAFCGILPSLNAYWESFPWRYPFPECWPFLPHQRQQRTSYAFPGSVEVEGGQVLVVGILCWGPAFYHWFPVAACWRDIVGMRGRKVNLVVGLEGFPSLSCYQHFAVPKCCCLVDTSLLPVGMYWRGNLIVPHPPLEILGDCFCLLGIPLVW